MVEVETLVVIIVIEAFMVVDIIVVEVVLVPALVLEEAEVAVLAPEVVEQVVREKTSMEPI